MLETIWRLFFTRWWISLSRTSFSFSDARSLVSTSFRSEMSRIAADTSTPSSVSIGLRLISTGNSLPSLRRPKSSNPDPIGRTRGSAKNPPRWPTCRPRKRSGTNVSTGIPRRFSRVCLKSRSACVLRMTILPSRLTTTIASGAASRKPRNLASTFFRAVVSRMMLMTRVPVSVFSGLRLISTGNSLPSLRRPESSLPSPMGRVWGSRK